MDTVGFVKVFLEKAECVSVRGVYIESRMIGQTFSCALSRPAAPFADKYIHIYNYYFFIIFFDLESSLVFLNSAGADNKFESLLHGIRLCVFFPRGSLLENVWLKLNLGTFFFQKMLVKVGDKQDEKKGTRKRGTRKYSKAIL